MEDLETEIEGILINGVDIIKATCKTIIREIETVMQRQTADGRE
jgi:hypothetical protein